MELLVTLLSVLLLTGCGPLKAKDGTNGTNGQNGSIGSPGAPGPQGPAGQDAILDSGPVGPGITGKSYTGCHHDYLYFSNGWLIFTHQANGTGDQGAGTTGFNVWRVDIPDFALISEVGNVTYCNLHFDKVTKKLTYTIVDNTDHLQGYQGVIQL